MPPPPEEKQKRDASIERLAKLLREDPIVRNAFRYYANGTIEYIDFLTESVIALSDLHADLKRRHLKLLEVSKTPITLSSTDQLSGPLEQPNVQESTARDVSKA